MTDMSPYTVLVVGMGKRGMHHATAFNANPRFKVTGICDIDAKRLEDAAAKLGGPRTGADVLPPAFERAGAGRLALLAVVEISVYAM